MANYAGECAIGLVRKIPHQAFTVFLEGEEFDLDQLVRLQRVDGGHDNFVAEASFSDLDYGLQMMSQFTQLVALGTGGFSHDYAPRNA